MKRIRYAKYVEEDFGVSTEDLAKALSDFLLESGFQSQYYGFSELNNQSLEQLKEAIRRALESGDLFDRERAEEMQQQLSNLSPEQMDQLLERMAARLEQEGYISREEDQNGDVRVEVTDKGVDFLGFKTLKDLMGGLGRSSFGAHETRELATASSPAAGAAPGSSATC